MGALIAMSNLFQTTFGWTGIIVNNCCCCLTLNVGTNVISIFSTLSALAVFVLYGCSAILVPDLPPGRLLFYASMAVTGLVQGVFGCFLIYGAFARKPKYTVPWTGLAWCQAVALLALAVTGTVLLGYNRRLETTAAISSVISVYCVYALVLFYFASVVNSRRQQMLIEERTKTAKLLMRHRVLPNYYV